MIASDASFITIKSVMVNLKIIGVKEAFARGLKFERI